MPFKIKNSSSRETAFCKTPVNSAPRVKSILKKKSIIPNVVTDNMDSVGIRIPIDEMAHNFLSLVDVPIAAPSANISGKPSGTKVLDIKDEFDGLVNIIIDHG